MPKLVDVGLRTKAKFATAGVLLAFLVLGLVFVAAQREQGIVLSAVEEHYLSQTAALSKSFSDLSHSHTQLFDLLASGAQSLDEEAVYQNAKPIIVRLRKIAADVRELSEVGTGPSVDRNHRITGKMLGYIARHIDKYIDGITAIVEMATVDVGLARRGLAGQANQLYSHLNHDFLVVMDRARAEASAAMSHAAGTARSHTVAFSLATVVGVALVLLFGLMISRTLVRNLEEMTIDMSSLANGELTVEIRRADRGDEVGAMARALAVFRDNALKLQRGEAELRLARDELEARIIERTAALDRSNEELRTEVEERRRAEQSLRESERRYRNLVEQSPDPIFVTNQGVIAFANTAAVKAVGASRRAELVGSPAIELLHPEDREQLQRSGDLATDRAQARGFIKARYLRRNGLVFHGESTSTSLIWGGEPAEMTVVRDVSDRVQAEEEKTALESRLRQAQKMQSLGTLAGSTAHEFNNMLLPMMGLTELAIDDIRGNDQAIFYLEKVLETGKRAAKLVERVLTFSRAEDAELKPLELVSVVTEAVELLETTLPATIEIETRIDGEPQTVLADETQIHQVVLNLGTNAMHAMEGKVGKLTIELARVELDQSRAFGASEPRPGTYARLTVRDIGHGMDQQVLDRIFEPFFTTKQVGKGTGLGLAMIHGIVTAHSGFVEVESAPGDGTSFGVYLPLLNGQSEPALRRSART